jgi:cell division septum initiation protein DivIVA
MAEQITNEARETARKALDEADKLINAAQQKAQRITEEAQETATKARELVDKLDKLGE